jgi:hypothetical protein
MKSFKQHLEESTVNTVIEMNDKDFDNLLDNLSEKELIEVEEGIIGAIAKGVKKVGSAAVSGVKKVANRVSTSGRADAAQAKLAKIQKKKADQQRLAKAKSDIKQAKSEAVEYPHMMYDPKTGKGYEAKDEADHDKMAKMGYTHDKPEVKESRNIVDTITQVVSPVLAEDGYSQNATGDGTDLALNDIKNADMLKQLNAHVGMIGCREYVNPKGALLQLQGKLATIGLSFDIPAMTEDKGVDKMPLKQFGGITGKSVTTPIDELDNDNYAEGLSLQIEYETLKTGMTKVYCKII